MEIQPASENLTALRSVEDRAVDREPIFSAVRELLSGSTHKTDRTDSTQKLSSHGSLLEAIPGFGSPADLVARLLQRAPEEWFSSHPPPVLGSVVGSAFETLSTWNHAQSTGDQARNNQSSRVLVNGRIGSRPRGAEGREASTDLLGYDTVDTICIALLDRPFIINTINAVLRSHDRRPIVFLHPILSLGSESSSLSYIELHPRATQGDLPEGPPEDAFNELLESLRISLGHLAEVADDFPEMRSAIASSAGPLGKITLTPTPATSTRPTRGHPASHEAKNILPLSSDDNSPEALIEVKEFLHWLLADSMVIEGVALWPCTENSIASDAIRKLGVFRGTDAFTEQLLTEVRSDVSRLIASSHHLAFSLLSVKSLVHHRGRLSSVQVRIPISVAPHAAQNGAAVLSIIGQLTSKAMAEEGSRIPLVRTHLRAVLEAEGLRPSSHLYKTALSIIDATPKNVVFLSDDSTLHRQIRVLLDALQRNERVSMVSLDRAKRGVWALVALPSDEFTNDIRCSVVEVFCAHLGLSEDAVDASITSVDDPLCRIYLYAPVSSQMNHAALRALQDALLQASKGWASTLSDILKARSTERVPSNGQGHLTASPSSMLPSALEASAKVPHGNNDVRVFRFHHAFPEDYQASNSPQQAADDVLLLETLSEARPLAVKISGPSDSLVISVCQRGREITLSKSLPIIEHAGFEVLHERASRVQPLGSDSIYLHRFPVEIRNKVLVPSDDAEFEHRKTIVAAGLERVFLGQCEDDILNSLMTTAGLDVSTLSLLRAYCMLLWQVRKFATRHTIREALVKHPALAKQFWEIARLKFDPAVSATQAERSALVEQELSKLRAALHDVSDITDDRILRALTSLLHLTVRTNFFVSRLPGSAGLRTPGPQAEVVALKIHSEQLELLSAPRPLYEVFVSAPLFEGVHLRGSRVARGGIRWSDRREDFRSEVRDLMRTQQVKNAIIVPSGAKGGFVVKDLPQERSTQASAVKSCYQEFIRALLSITDNRVDGTLVPPPGVVCHDEPDPYLVVAADKGTASFSDVANAIAVDEFNFWLGDAFASGGSNGYDHKKLGITARGAWEAVRQHFKDARIDIETTPFTVIGIGDMSGDVFGNGLLESKHSRLICAFNHKHVFIDPNPDPSTSWKERSRLFNLPFSQWTDYDPKVLSPGAMIFERAAKVVALTPEARLALDLPAACPKTLTGEQIISCILKTPADLLWNGGIGTYVKSRDESDADVDDSANDTVRINADEVRARVVSEGGNLGFTQQARIDFAERGGLINTDAIDNSGGVDTSDHEVNLKILLAPEVQSGQLSIAERNEILKALAPEVVEDVLSHNRGQAVLLASSAKRGSKNLDYFKSLMSELVRRGYLSREVHILPSDETLEDRVRNGAGLYRPELAVCTAGVKLWVKDELLNSGITKDPALSSVLLGYFPGALRERFLRAIKAHPLASNIIATKVANEMVETVGLTFVHRMCLSQSVEPSLVLTALLAAQSLLQTAERRAAIQRFDSFEQHELFLKLRIELSASLREATTWLIANHASEYRAASQESSSGFDGTQRPGTIDALTARYATHLSRLYTQPLQILTGRLHQYVSDRTPEYLEKNLDQQTALIFAASPLTPIFFEILWSAAQISGEASTDQGVDQAAMVYSSLVDLLGLFPILAAQRTVAATTKWEHELRLNAYDEIRRGVSALTVYVVKKGASTPTEVDVILKGMPGIARLRLTVGEISEARPHVAMLGVFARQLRLFSP